MKLRNKKTGEIMKAEAREDGIYLWDEQTKHWWIYELDMLASGWEYYVEPKEPLIKDEKVRNAVRAWAEAWNKNKLYKDADNVLSTVDNFVIQFGQTAFIDLEEKRAYTIAELCGEEEE